MATVALVKGEADADAFYGVYGYGAYPYATTAYAGYPYAYGAYAYGGYPYAHAAYAAPVATATAQVSPSSSLTTLGLADASIPAVAGGYAGAGRYVANSAGVVHVAKREAEAEAEADPALFYSAYGYAGYPYTAGYSAYPYGYSAAYPYSYGYPYAYSSYAHVAAPAVAAPVVEAEAAPAVAAPAYAYGGYPYAHAAYAAPVATATAQVSPSSSLTTLGLADASIPAVAGGYAGAGRYVANSAGVVHVAKREAEAEAEADPALLYTSAYPYSYGYPYAAGYSAAYPYSYGYPYAYGAYPYAHHAAYAAPVVAAPTATAQVSPSASLTTLGLADASIPAVAGGYAGAGRYVANSAGVVHVA